jgi:phage tail-like protein
VEASLFGSPALGAVVGAVASAVLGGFSEVQGLNAELDMETYEEGGKQDGPHRFVKRSKFPNLVFKSGVSPNPGLWDWYRGVANGTGPRKRKNGLIMLTERGSLASGTPVAGLLRVPIAVWRFSNGYPERMQGPTLNARGNEVAIESMEISHEGLERLSPTMIPGIGAVAGALGL